MKVCGKCGTELILGETWLSCSMRQQRNICKACRRAYRKQRRMKYGNRIRKQKHASYLRNREHVLVKAKVYRDSHKEQVYQTIKAWNKRNPDKVAFYAAHAYAKRKGATGSHTEAEWEMYQAMAEHKCLACGSDDPLTKDHIVPLAKGGTDFIHNIQPLCQSCNSRKCDQFINYWLPLG